MIRFDRAKYTGMNQIGPGNLVIAFSEDVLPKPAVVVRSDSYEGALLFIFDTLQVASVDGRSSALCLGTPVFRFDPNSAFSANASAASGTLLVRDVGPAVYQKRGDQPDAGTIWSLSGGDVSGFPRSARIPAFAQWEVGYEENGEFVLVAAINSGAGA